MNKEDNNNIVTMDAKGQSLGRLASRIAFLLQDKHLPRYAPNLEGKTKVVIENLKAITFPKTKLHSKIYYKHTPYLGHLKEISLEKLWQKNPKEVLRKAVRGMLPINKLRSRRMKRLEIHC